MPDLSRDEVDAKLAASEAKVDARLANFDTSIKTGFADMRAEMARLQAEIQKNTSDLVKWGIGLAIASVGTTVGLLTYINKATEKPSAPPAAQQPIVIAVPPANAPASVVPPAPANK
jgi:hypothetical protein